MERLDEFPNFGPEPVMPWEESVDVGVWPFDASAGTPLRDFNSRTLIRKRAEVEAKNGAGHYFDSLIEAIDQVLREREGE